MLSNLEPRLPVESNLHHHELALSEADAEDDDSLSSSDSESDSGDNEAGGSELPWTEEEDELLRSSAEGMDPKNWAAIAEMVPGRTNRECKRRWGQLMRSGEGGRARTPWTKEEDEQLKELVAVHGSKAWKMISSMMPGRKSKQCRERWTNVVDPKLNYAPWTEEEEQILILAQQELGNKWSQIEKRLPGRSANSIKNYWYSALRRGERKRAKMERKANQPEGKKRRPRKPKVSEEEDLPAMPVDDAADDSAQGDNENKPKKKNNKRKRKQDEAADDNLNGVNDAALAVEDAGTSDEVDDKPAKKAKKTKEAKATKKDSLEITGEADVSTEVLEKSAKVKAKKGSKVADAEVPTTTNSEVSPAAIAIPVSASEEDSQGNGKSGKRKAAKPTEEEKLLKPMAKKRRKNIAITDENLST